MDSIAPVALDSLEVSGPMLKMIVRLGGAAGGPAGGTGTVLPVVVGFATETTTAPGVYVSTKGTVLPFSVTVLKMPDTPFEAVTTLYCVPGM